MAVPSVLYNSPQVICPRQSVPCRSLCIFIPLDHRFRHRNFPVANIPTVASFPSAITASPGFFHLRASSQNSHPFPAFVPLSKSPRSFPLPANSRCSLPRPSVLARNIPATRVGPFMTRSRSLARPYYRSEADSAHCASVISSPL
jgi:hypothetical protein